MARFPLFHSFSECWMDTERVWFGPLRGVVSSDLNISNQPSISNSNSREQTTNKTYNRVCCRSIPGAPRPNFYNNVQYYEHYSHPRRLPNMKTQFLRNNSTKKLEKKTRSYEEVSFFPAVRKAELAEYSVSDSIRSQHKTLFKRTISIRSRWKVCRYS